MDQTEWSANMFKKAFPVKAIDIKCDQTTPNAFYRNGKFYIKLLWLRGFHYFIVSQPANLRQIPSNKGTREYKNTKNDYKRLSRLVKNARLKGLIPDDQMFDNRNDPIIEPASRSRFAVNSLEFDISSGYYFSNYIDIMKDWDGFLDKISVNPMFNRNRFCNQMYEIIVVTEKLTIKSTIEDMCMDYGANCLIVKGQSSFTRIIDICKKAQITNRPVLLLGIYDLDCAGWDMPVSFINNVKSYYKHPDHKLKRVALLRDQAEQYDLPDAFEPDDKGYKEKVKQRFYNETNGTSCIELDAMDNNVMKDLLKVELDKYSGLKLDKIQQRRFEKKEKRRVRQILNDFDYSDFEKKYKRYYKRYAKFFKFVSDKLNFLDEHYEFLSNKISEIEQEIENELDERLRDD